MAFGAAMAEANGVIKEFLFARMYRHWRVRRMSGKARRVTGEMFAMLLQDPNMLPDDWRHRAGEIGGTARAAVTVADYVGGMTDRFAREEHLRLTDLSVAGVILSLSPRGIGPG